MERYTIIHNVEQQSRKYDFTFHNGVNVRVDFHAAPTLTGDASQASGLEIYDRDRNNITDFVVRNAKQTQRQRNRSHAAPLSSQDVHQLINFCKTLAKDDLHRARTER